VRGEVNRILRAPLSCRTAKRRENRDAPVARGNISLACSNGGSDNLRVEVVFCFWQCDKKNHGWREGPPRPFPAKVSICWPGLHPPVKSVSNEKKNTGGRQFSRALVSSTLNQFPILTPNLFAPFTRRMPAARSGLSRPVSEAS
jgi:hypothetical protein